MQLLEEWHIEVHVPPHPGDDVTDRIAGDVEAAVRQFADDLTHRLRFAYRLGDIEVRVSR